MSDAPVLEVPMWHYSDTQYNARKPNLEKDPKCLVAQSLATSMLAAVVFFIAAVVQMAIVVTMQGMIYQHGGDGRALPEYKHCLSDDLQMAIDCNEKANWSNVTIPSFGKDKPVYVGFIIALTVYNAMLCFYGLYEKRFFDIVSFLIVNVLTMLYACFEAWQFRPFGPNCSDLPKACWLAIGSIFVLLSFTVLFSCLTFCIYKDFGWKVFKGVKCEDNTRKYYLWYEALSSGVKLLILFTVFFSVAQLTLLLTPDNYEFDLTIILLVVAIVAYFVLQLTIFNNSLTGYLALIIAGLLLLAYYSFKIYRFATKSCPICHMLTDSLDDEYRSLELLLETCTSNNNATLNAETDRSIQFQNLIVFASVNLITTLAVLAIFLGFRCQQGDMLKDQFLQSPSKILQLITVLQSPSILQLICSRRWIRRINARIVAIIILCHVHVLIIVLIFVFCK